MHPLIIKSIETSYNRSNHLPDFRPGDTVRVHTIVKEATTSASRSSRAS